MTPLEGVDRLLIDGNNLLHRVSGNVDPGSIRLLLARLSGVLPTTLPTVVMLDGHAASGTDRRQRIRRGLEIHHAGSLTADEALLNIVRDASPRNRAGVFLVTDDRALTDKARHLGARTKRLDWLEQILAMPPAHGTGGSTIGRKGVSAPPSSTDEEKVPWQPGRGATRKRGNPKKQPKA
jgi:rRNA-processing protein FCF1